jgi:hypothetical protein
VGQFKVEVIAVGPHGCDRETKDGETVEPCGNEERCPDCMTRALVDTIKESGMEIEKATFTHWPGTASEVEDDLLTGKRKGSF